MESERNLCKQRLCKSFNTNAHKHHPKGRNTFFFPLLFLKRKRKKEKKKKRKKKEKKRKEKKRGNKGCDKSIKQWGKPQQAFWKWYLVHACNEDVRRPTGTKYQLLGVGLVYMSDCSASYNTKFMQGCCKIGQI